MITGDAVPVTPLVRRVLAPNPGMMTGPGTNTYLVGDDEVVVIDPGPDHAGHLDAVAAAGGGRIRWIIVTHTHVDHWPGVTGLRERTGAEVKAFDSRDGLVVDASLTDGDTVTGAGFTLRVVHTPGHASNHLCYLLEEERLLFSGDHIMDGSTVVISPPDGDMAQYLDSLSKVRALDVAAIAPGHGELITDPSQRIDDYVSHRREREAQVVETVRSLGAATPARVVESIYTDVPQVLHPVAARSVWAHLRKLAADGAAVTDDGDDIEAAWRLA